MEKKAYVKPSLESETFIPNAYCNSCGDHGVNYYFQCNASHLIGGLGGSVYEAYRSPYTPCSERHIANSTDEFKRGYISWGIIEGWATEVIIWGGPDGRNTHCTTNLDVDEWETAKS